MTTRGTLLGWLLIGSVGGMLVEGCGATSSRQFIKGTKAAGTGGKDMGTMTVQPQGGQGGAGSLAPYDVLCGVPATQFCVPDLASNDLCKPSIGGATASPPSAGRSAGGDASSGAPAEGGAPAAGASGVAGESVAQAGNGGAPAGGQGGESLLAAGASGTPADTGGGGVGGEGPAISLPGSGTGGLAASAAGRGSVAAGSGGMPVSTLSPTSCQVTADPKHKSRPLAQCLPAGTRKESESCFSGADCEPGLACVGDGPGQCRKYCCSGEDSCGIHTHCAVESLVPPGDGRDPFSVPVCMPVVDCSLAETYPCPDGATCSCPTDSACVVVSDDGTTSCVATSELPADGEGVEGKACPCAWGFVCSEATKECVKLCQVAASVLDCGGARCQASIALPVGWGTCVGVPPKGSN